MGHQRRLDPDQFQRRRRLEEYPLHWRIGYVGALSMCKARERVRLPACLREYFDDDNPSHNEGIGDEGAVATPRYSFGAHDCGAPDAGHVNQLLKSLGEGGRLHVVRVTTEAFVSPAGVW